MRYSFILQIHRVRWTNLLTTFFQSHTSYMNSLLHETEVQGGMQQISSVGEKVEKCGDKVSATAFRVFETACLYTENEFFCVRHS
jgi:hypothetical protein